jgi:hypothetical protein
MPRLLGRRDGRRDPVVEGRKLKCECGDCKTCRHRAYMYAYYRRPGKAAVLRARVAAYREANLEVVRERDRKRGYRVYDPDKAKARRKAHKALRRGKLKRQPCEVCGVGKAQMHHDDYTKPLDVRWLCTTHHGELHRKLDVIPA